jgi:hypothetical protein
LYGAIALVWYSGITGTINSWFYLATGLLALEGIIIALNRGYCPIIYLHRWYGDEKRFYELFIPERFAKYAFVFLFGVIVAGYALVILKTC